jgi:excinuclease ABC subunit B
MSAEFDLQSEFEPMGDQPDAIAALVDGLNGDRRFQILEGVTGSGKTFTIANVIARYGRPVLVLSHNKTLAAQLYGELKAFFPNNAVEYFVSYYDYYQPEAYIPQTDTLIDKDASINKEIERLRLSATNSLLTREDVIIVASISCIYGLGSPEDYTDMLVSMHTGEQLSRNDVLTRLVDIQYARNDYGTDPGGFRVRGDTLDIFPSYSESGIRIEWFGDEIDGISEIEPLTGHRIRSMDRVAISPAKHFVIPQEKIDRALKLIRRELDERVRWFEEHGKLIEAQRIRQRTMFDIEMIKELGYCSGIENYSRHLSGRAAGSTPATLLHYFAGDFLTVIDESHATIPQLRAMYNGDQARKSTLIEYGFRLPSAKDNRPLNFDEFFEVVGPVIFMTATPGAYELAVAPDPVRQVIRPTGLVDPPVEVRPLANQIDDLMEEIRRHTERGERTLVTTLTKRTSEDLADYLRESGIRVEYLHSDIDAIERVEILRRLRLGEFDCLVGINLLREGLDLPEVALVAILDADKEGFLRSETALIQTAGRTARHADGKVILYADVITDSMRRMMQKTEERRERQLRYNAEHGITPRTTLRAIDGGLRGDYEEAEETCKAVVCEAESDYERYLMEQELEREMLKAAKNLEFERAALLRDELLEIRGER